MPEAAWDLSRFDDSSVAFLGATPARQVALGPCFARSENAPQCAHCDSGNCGDRWSHEMVASRNSRAGLDLHAMLGKKLTLQTALADRTLSPRSGIVTGATSDEAV